jgi:hypothetical protein
MDAAGALEQTEVENARSMPRSRPASSSPERSPGRPAPPLVFLTMGIVDDRYNACCGAVGYAAGPDASIDVWKGSDQWSWNKFAAHAVGFS